MKPPTTQPPVSIFAVPTHLAIVQAVLTGLEEEGVPASVTERDCGEATLLSAQAAMAASFDLGFGIATDGTVHLRHSRLPEVHLARPLPPGTELLELRLLGQNAGRLVKRLPLTLTSNVTWPHPITVRPTSQNT